MDRLIPAMRRVFDALPEPHYLVVNAFVHTFNVDYLFFAPRTMAVLEFKQVTMPFELNGNGPCYFLMPDGTRSSALFGKKNKNPFQQVRDYRGALLSFLNLHSTRFLGEQKAKTIVFRVSAVLVTSPVLPSGNKIDLGNVPYFRISGEDRLPHLLTQLADGPEIRDEEIRSLLLSGMHLRPLVEANVPDVADRRVHDGSLRIDPSVDTAVPSGRLEVDLEPPEWVRTRQRQGRSLTVRLLDAAETRLERMVRRTLGPGDAVIPANILRAMKLEAADWLQVIGEKRYSPNLFIIEMHETNRLALSHIENVLPRELAREFTSFAARNGWRLAAAVRVRLSSDPVVRRGSVRVVAWSDDFVGTVVPPPPRIEVRVFSRDSLVARAQFDTDAMTLGTAPACSIALALPQVATSDARFLISRRHATIRRSGDRFQIFDGDGKGGRSTNGTYVNGKRLGSLPVSIGPGARVVLGPVDPRGLPLEGAVRVELAPRDG